MVKPKIKIENIEAENFYTASASEIHISEEGLSTINLLPIGTWKGYIDPLTNEKRTFKITNKEVDYAVAYFKAVKEKNPGRDLVIDNDHLTLKDTYAPAFGWIKDLVNAGNAGLKAVIEWTELGKEAITKKFYKYISPVFFWNGTDKITGENIPFGILNAGLTNEPFFDELEPVTAARNIKQIIHLTKTNPLNAEGEKIMDELLERLRYFIGLPITATAAEIAAELEKLITQLKEVSPETDTVAAKAITGIIEKSKSENAFRNEVLSVLELKPESTIDEVKATVLTAKQSVVLAATLQSKIDDLEKKSFEKEVDQVIAKAMVEGKIVPATRDAMKKFATTDLESFKNFIAKSPQIVPLGELNNNSRRDQGADEDDPVILAKAAQDYITAEAKSGRKVTVTEAMFNIKKRT